MSDTENASDDEIVAVFEEYPEALAARIASRFRLPTPTESFDFHEKGNINQQTFLLEAGREVSRGSFLLQRINQHVFTRPDRVMRAMIASLDAQRRAIDRGIVPAGREWEAITLIPTRAGESYLRCADRRGVSYWRLMVKIPECQTFKSLGELEDRSRQLFAAEEAGRGLAMYGDFTADMDVADLESPLPGYRQTDVYFDQLDSVLAGCRTEEAADGFLPDDPVLRHSVSQHFLIHASEGEYRRRLDFADVRRLVDLTLENREFGTKLLRAMDDGRIRRVAIHGDTKLDNFLFSSRTGQVKAVVDLDTIMPHTWLADWGDMVRSLANLAGEKERDLSRVRVDMEVFEALVRGFLTTAREVTAAEIELMVDAVQVIALELGLRFLADYIRGDSYFKLSPADPPDLNRVRASVQLTLFERLRETADTAARLVETYAKKR